MDETAYSYVDVNEFDGDIYSNKVIQDTLTVTIDGEDRKIGGSITINRNKRGYYSVNFQTGKKSIVINPLAIMKNTPKEIAEEVINEGYRFVDGMEKYLGKYIQGMAYKLDEQSYRC